MNFGTGIVAFTANLGGTPIDLYPSIPMDQMREYVRVQWTTDEDGSTVAVVQHADTREGADIGPWKRVVDWGRHRVFYKPVYWGWRPCSTDFEL